MNINFLWQYFFNMKAILLMLGFEAIFLATFYIEETLQNIYILFEKSHPKI